MPPTIKISPSQQKSLNNLAQKNGIKFIILYGSYANGNAKAESDLDIAILHNGKDKFPFLKVFDEMQKIFPDHEVDLSILNHADSLFLYEVTGNGKLLFGKTLDFVQFRAYIFRRYFDEASLFELKKILLKKQHKLIKSKIS